MIAVNINRQVRSEVIGDTKFISLRIKKSLRSRVIINSLRQCDWPAGAIYNVERNAVPVTKLVIANKVRVIGFIIIRGIIFPTVYIFSRQWVISTQENA